MTDGKHARVPNKALFIDEHLDAHRAAFFMWPQRAHIVRKRLGKHGQHAIDQIHARRAFASLEVDPRIPRNVVRYIGNMDAQNEEPRACSRRSIVCRAGNAQPGAALLLMASALWALRSVAGPSSQTHAALTASSKSFASSGSTVNESSLLNST